MPLIIGLCVTDLYSTNYWIICDGLVCDGLALIIGLYMTDLYGTNYWILCDGFVSH